MRWLSVLVLSSGMAGASLASCASERPPSENAPFPPVGPPLDAGDGAVPCETCSGTKRLFPTPALPTVAYAGCVFASPLAFGPPTKRRILVATGSGEVAALHPRTGAPDWQIQLPAPNGERAMAVATPVLVGSRAVVAYHTRRDDGAAPHVALPKLRQRVVVVDTQSGAIDEAFPPIDLAAAIGTPSGAVAFEADQALARGALVHLVPPGGTLGRVYVTFGNVRDIQPWHGWMFEIDLDAWNARGAQSATHAVFLTTPETDCGPRGESGSRERKCGGGLWSPSGPLVTLDTAGYALVVASGNGQLDVPRRDYANTLMRLRPGLAFDPGCDSVACAGFEPNAPSPACATSCKDLFIPRLMPGQTFVPASGACDGVGLYECWQRLDYVGGSTPARVRTGLETHGFAYPAKDGALYLVDESHMGTMLDRLPLVDVCGTRTDPCKQDWAGMIVTQPAVVAERDRDLVIVPTFMPDETHPAGIVAVDVRTDAGKPRFETRWRFPDFGSRAAIQRFRRHPSRLTAASFGPNAELLGWVVEAAAPGGKGRLVGLRLTDGRLVADIELSSAGFRFTAPLVEDGVVYVSSCGSDSGPGGIEAYEIRP
jgi:hypothetical protein